MTVRHIGARIRRLEQLTIGLNREMGIIGAGDDPLLYLERQAWGFADRAVFCNCHGGFIRGYNLLQNSFQPILARASLPRIRFHDLRHTHATALLSKGHPIKAVSQRLGHSDVGITLRVYAHVLPADDAKLAGALQAMYA
jgi:integrase